MVRTTGPKPIDSRTLMYTISSAWRARYTSHATPAATITIASVERVSPLGRSSRSWRSVRSAMQSARPVEEFGDDLRDVAVLDIGGIVHRAHVGGRDAAAQSLERGAQHGVLQQRLGARHRRGVVRREVMTVVVE